MLRQCKYLILDEADRMITMGFEENVETVLRAMRGETIDVDDDGNVSNLAADTAVTISDADRPTIHMFSATMPQAVSNLAKTYLHQPVYVQIGDVDSMKNRNIRQEIMLVKQPRKLQTVQDILRQHSRKPTIVFVNARKSADILARDLRNSEWCCWGSWDTSRTVCWCVVFLLSCLFSCLTFLPFLPVLWLLVLFLFFCTTGGVRCSEYHGGHSQDARELALSSFKNGAVHVLIATDVAGRGLDVKGVQLVVNYDMANDIEKYTHRIGRTGRAGLTGTAITLLTMEDATIFEELEKYLKATKTNISHDLMQAFVKGNKEKGKGRW